MPNRSIRALLTASLVAVVFAAGLSASHSWGGYHWARTTSQFTLKVGDNLTSSTWRGHLAQTSSDWNSGNSPLLTAIVAGQSRKRCSMVAGTTQVCNDTYGRHGEDERHLLQHGDLQQSERA
jgi:hypothetical protein